MKSPITLRTALPLLGVIALLVTPSSRAQTSIFSNNFSDFAEGTVFAPTNYSQTLNGVTTLVTNYVQGGTASSVITNASGSAWARYDLSGDTNETGSGAQGFYHADFSTPNSNANMRILFDVVVGATSANFNGGFSLSLNDSTSPNTSQYLMRVSDGGPIAIFTNAISPETFLMIGTSTAGIINKYQVDLNFPLGTYSIFQNGVALTNDVAIPSYLNSVSMPSLEFVFDEAWGGGNTFLLGNVVVQVPEPSAFTAVGTGLALLAFLRRRRA